MRKPKLKEKRESVRLDLECPGRVRLHRRWFGRKDFESAVVGKPSLFGLRLATRNPFETGNQMDIDVDLDSLGVSDPCRLRGEIVWSRPCPKTGRHLAGVRLLDKSRDREAWQRAIRSRLKDLDLHPKVSQFKPV